ncbi:RodZ domain-containing protein [Solimonas terrae]|uniref:Helix-turn-helix domain-containing protein n=1 Tax=Solimonas terrae TaxID=1396819 RepID=A0A6M2BQ18_9GAMM|nr:RodZ family helix-turn-helix domain-containing protein [Solimonas terrae]NGY04548.1 helix-turn-helix domain-containing protein [Solimonas terrae]
MTTEPNENEVVTEAASAAEVASPAAALSPGTMIREARQAQRLSVDDLAAHTKLARATVEALERDDFGALLEPVYVRGYYRKCAKVLGVDEKALIDAYASRVAQRAPQAPAKLRLASGTELGSSSRLPMAMAVLFVIIAVAICAFLWWVRGATSKFDTARPGLPSINATPSPAAPSALTPLASDTVAAPAESATAGAAQGNAMPPVPQAGESAAPAGEAAANSDNPVPASAAAVGSGRLQLVFTGQSWVHITDASGKTLLDGLIASGARRGLDGQPPFELAIGKASAVSVQFDGQTVDLQPYTRDNATAHLKLPATP